MLNNTEADVRTDTLIRVMALFFVAIIVLAVTTNPIPREPTLVSGLLPSKGWPTTAAAGPSSTWTIT